MRTSSFIRSGFATFAIATMAMACGSDSATAPKYQPQIVNTPNVAFSFQATGLQDITDAVSYTWHVSSGSIIIHPATATTSGTITLTIKDALGNIVYDGNVPASGDITPPVGAAGNWKVRVDLQNYTGTINFALQMQ